MQVSRRRRRWTPASTSVPERFVLENEKEIQLVDRILKTLRPLRLDWLEALVFYQHYWAAVDLPTVAATFDIPLQELVQARRRLVTKAAMLLGYIPPDDSIGPLTMELPMSLDERTRRVSELLAQGLSWKEIGEKLGANPWTLWRYHQRHVVGRSRGG